MPILTIVTFTDADGDEFPIAIPGFNDKETDDSLEAQARDIIHEEEQMRPTLPLTLKSIERPK